ncbi:MAG: rRNA maturation RNase YbeY [Lachnospiraceae bacterium]|nr:rRNA maturation RNase YbeY [Lachnospiraceae bacterium]
MTFYADNETNHQMGFSWEELYETVALAVLDSEKCPYECQVNLVLTDNNGIHEINKETRNIDRPTDVLSFPNVSYEKEADFETLEECGFDCFDPDSGELILGDIIISVDKVVEQAAEYGHSQRREFAFLIAHSMLHLCGYDHMTEEEEKIMISKQEAILNLLGITRDSV